MTSEEAQAPQSGMTRLDHGAAVKAAEDVVGLLGDPSLTWGISLEATFSEPVEPLAAQERLDALVRKHPHLGRAPRLQEVASSEWDRRREEASVSAFGEDGELVRVLIDDEHRRFLVAAHHGASDGIGLLSIMGAAAGRPLTSSARGVGESRPPEGFIASSFKRLWEAIVTPPARFGGEPTPAQAGPGEFLVQSEPIGAKVNSGRLTAALKQVHGQWGRRRGSGGSRFVVVMGVSRRAPGTVAPDRQTGYMRMHLPEGWKADEVGRAIAERLPEPDVPATSAGGIGPVVMRLLHHRLGYTVNVSNIGRVSGEGLLSMATFPALNGAQALGVGLVSTDAGAVISLRARRSEFSSAEVDELLELVVREVHALDA